MSLDTQMLEQTKESSENRANMINVQAVRNQARRPGTWE